MLENNVVKLPEVIVFAGPNGSVKSTITQMAKISIIIGIINIGVMMI